MWWMMAIQAAGNEIQGLQQKNMTAANRSINLANSKQMAARQGWETGHSEMAQAYGLQDTRTRAESNIYKLNQDKQVMSTEAATSAKMQQADLAVSAAVTGTTGSFVDVGSTSIKQQADAAGREIERHYSKLEREERDVIRSSTYSLYALDKKFQPPEYTIDNPGNQFDIKDYVPAFWES